MVPNRSTNLRVPVELRDEIARIAEHRGTTLVEVVTEAVRRLGRDDWWNDLHSNLDAMPDASSIHYAAETDRLDGTTSDGMNR